MVREGIMNSKGLKNEYSYHTALGTDVFGNITRLNNTLEGIEGNIKYAVNDIEFIKRDIKS